VPIYCRKCRKEVPDLLATETSTQCPSCGAPISFKDGIPRTSARLLLKDGDETRGEFQINQTISIGKDKASYVQILHPTVSLKHAEIQPAGNTYVLRDLGSQAGTFLKGQKISEAPLNDGDEFKVGEIRFVFLNPPEALLPGQDFAISYTASAQDVQNVTAAVSPEKISVPQGPAKTGESLSLTAELQRLARVFEIGRELAGCTDLALVLETVMEAVFEHVTPSRAAILLKHPSTGELYTTVARTAKTGKQRAHISISRSVVNEAMSRKDALLIADTGTLRVGDEHTIRRQGIRSALCVPLMFKGSSLGCIYMDSLDLTKMFSESDLRLVAGIGGMAAVAVINARLIARVGQEEKLRRELESRRAGDGWSSGMTGLAVKEVTVLVLRVAGAGQLLDGQHPERVATLLQELLGILVDRLNPFEGLVAGMHGSSIVALFGLNSPQHVAAPSALKAAVEVQAMFGQLNAARQKRNLRPIWMSYALASGRVLAGQSQFRGRAEPSLVGGALDIAQTLAAHAETNQLLMSEATYESAKAIVSARKVAPIGTGDDAIVAYEAKGLK
jgi:class 3 adenylate cyclase